MTTDQGKLALASLKLLMPDTAKAFAVPPDQGKLALASLKLLLPSVE